MSNTMVTYPIVTAVSEAEKQLSICGPWKSTNQQQQWFLQYYLACCRGEEVPEIETFVSRKYEEINAILRDKGYSIQLEPFDPTGSVGFASILDFLLEWLREGKVTDIVTDDGEEFPAVHVDYDQGLSFYEADGHEQPIIYLPTKSDHRVYMSIVDQALEGFALIEKAEQLSGNNQRPWRGEFHEGVTFPMVDLNQEVDLKWLVGMEALDAHGIPVEIAQALQQTKLRMNQFGARAQSAVAIEARSLGLPPPDYIIDRPFLLWIERDGLCKPLFTGYITPEDWKDPGDIRK